MFRLVFVALAVLLALPAAHGQDRGPRFAHVTTLEQADAEAAQGRLARVHLFPLELGGPDEPQNVVYIPAGMEDAWRAIVGTIGRYAEEGLVDGLSVEPRYNGDSLVPCSVRFVATSSTGIGGFEPTLELWSCT